MSQPPTLPRRERPTPAARHWLVRATADAVAAEIAARHAVHPAVARILSARGWAPGDELPAFLNPLLRSLRNPYELTGMDGAIERTLTAIRRGERICVYGDYDVDGVTSTALVVSTLRFLGADPLPVIPHRLNDGYGMSTARVEEIGRNGCTLIITVDTGVSAIDQVRRASELGIDVVITDHHLAGNELPAAAAFVNPNRPEAIYPHARLCGVGVAFKFAHALLKASGRPEAEAKTFLLDQLDLVALGTVADVVPLLGENRIFVRHGMDVIAKSRRPGIRALLEVAGLGEKPITPHSIGFGLGPRINAAGRTQDASLALRLLLTSDPQEAVGIARQLDELNRDRQEIERSILEASLEEVNSTATSAMPHLLVVGGEGWHLGVVGIVASRLTDMYELPAIVLGIEEGYAKGSARSIPRFDIHDALTACAGHLLTYGGHAGAAGLKLHARSLPAFREAINDHAGRIFATLDRAQTVEVDALIEPGEFTWAFYDDLQKLQPFGEGNPAPVLMMRGVRSATIPRIVGKNHLKLRLRAGGLDFDAIGFGLGHLKPLFEEGPSDILFRAVQNTFNGATKLELELIDGRPAA